MASSQGAALPAAALALRLLALALLAASLAIIATAKVHDLFLLTVLDELDQTHITFQDVHAYTYVLSVGVVGCAYSLLVIPFAAINVAGRKMIGGSQGGTAFLLIADVVCSVLIATGAAAGLGFTIDYQRCIPYFDLELGSQYRKFYNLVDVSCSLLLVATVCLVIIVMMSAYSLTK